MKYLIYIACLLSISVSFYGQQQEYSEEKKCPVSYGLKLGNNLAYIPDVFEEIQENNPRLGFYAGGFITYAINPKWEVQLSTYYSKQGTDAVFIFSNDVFTQGIDLGAGFNVNYLSIPLMVHFNLNDKWYVGAGAYNAFLLNENLHLETTKSTESQYGVYLDEEGSFEEVRDILAQLGYDFDVEKETFDYGLQFDGGVRLSENVILNASYILGLHDIIKSRTENIQGSPTNSVFTLGFDYTF